MADIEEQFFEAFEIDNCRTCDYHGLECWECTDTYPQITDRILLKLICIANEYLDYPTSTNIKNIQARTLRMLLKVKKYFKDTYSSQDWHNELVRKVRRLFKEK